MVYVMSDIHGSLSRFQMVLEQIGLTAGDSLYVLGDVIDRGHFGIRILQELMEMPNATVCSALLFVSALWPQAVSASSITAASAAARILLHLFMFFSLLK